MRTATCMNAPCLGYGQEVAVGDDDSPVMCGMCGSWIIPPPPDPTPAPPDPRETAVAELIALGVSEATARQIAGLPPLTPTEPS